MRTREQNDEIALTLLREACARTGEAFDEPLGLEEPRALRTLGRVLTSDADVVARPPRTPQPPKPPGGRRIAVVAAPAAAALAAGIVLAIASLGTSPAALAQKFPIFAGASAKPARAALGIIPEPDTGASAARAIHTPDGTGYVMTSTNNKELCVATPAGSLAELHSVERAQRHVAVGSRHRFVGGCTAVAEAERKGVVLMLPVRGRVELVVVLPASASTPVVRSASSTATTLEPKDGTVTTLVSAPAVLEYKVRGTRVSTAIQPHPRVAKLAALQGTRER